MDAPTTQRQQTESTWQGDFLKFCRYGYGPFETTFKDKLKQHSEVLNEADTNGLRPVMLAAQNGQTAIIEHLLCYSDLILNDKDPDQKTVLHHIAIGYYRTRKDPLETLHLLDMVCGKLREKGQLAKLLNQGDGTGKTALRYCVDYRERKVVQALLEIGAEEYNNSHRFGSALMVAARSGDVRMVELLLEHGAQIDRNRIDWEGLRSSSMRTLLQAHLQRTRA